MQIKSVQNNNYKTNFTGKIIDTYALRKFKSGLSEIEVDTFEKYIKDVEKVDDGKKFVYEPTIIGNRKFAKIYELDNNGNTIEPHKFADDGKNPISVFKQMADWYKVRSKNIN